MLETSLADVVADGVAEASTSGRGALDALVGDLLSAQRLHLDQEIASTLAAYYRGVLTDPASLNEDARTTQNSLKTLAQLLQEGGAHLPAQEVDAPLGGGAVMGIAKHAR